MLLILFYGRRQWQPTQVLLPGKSHGRRNLVGCSPWGQEELDTTERLHFHFSLPCTGEGNGNPLQCSCLQNPRDGGAWWASVYGVAQSRTRLKWLSSSILFYAFQIVPFLCQHVIWNQNWFIRETLHKVLAVYETFRDVCLAETWVVITVTAICMELLLCSRYDMKALHPLTLLILTPTFGLGTLSELVSESRSIAQSYLTLCNPMDCSRPGSSVHGILQTRRVEWVTIPFYRGSSQPRGRTQVFHFAGRFLTIWSTREAQEYWSG